MMSQIGLGFAILLENVDDIAAELISHGSAAVRPCPPGVRRADADAGKLQIELGAFYRGASNIWAGSANSVEKASFSRAFVRAGFPQKHVHWDGEKVHAISSPDKVVITDLASLSSAIRAMLEVVCPGVLVKVTSK